MGWFTLIGVLGAFLVCVSCALRATFGRNLRGNVGITYQQHVVFARHKQLSRCPGSDARPFACDWTPQRDSLKMGADTLARQLRSRVRDEFFGPTSSARERIQDISAATARHTTRGSMILGKPLSPITGCILTNVPLPARTPAVGRETPLDRGRPPKSTQCGEIKGGGGGDGGERNSAGVFW